MTQKKRIKIYFRIYPMEKMIWDYLKILNDHKTIYIRYLQQLTKSKENTIPTFWTFHTDQVFFNQTQQQIYEDIVPEVLDSILQENDAIIMAYGQTGTGKSLTVNGLDNVFERRGILPRLASDIFQKLRSEAESLNLKIRIQASYVEFSKTEIFDLMKSYPNQIDNLKNLTKLKIKSFEELLKIIFKGEGRKLFSENCDYPSHICSSIFTFYITTKNSEMQKDNIHKYLAGSDTIGNFSCFYKKPREIGSANVIKTQLEQFFLVLNSNIPNYIKVKQRLNPMIQYLGDSLKKTTLFRAIGHIRVSKEDLLITISMLRFGELIGGLKATKYEINIDKELNQSRVDDLQQELSKLQTENKLDPFLIQQDLSKSLSEERFAHIERTVNEYLQNKITHLTLLNVTDINIAFEILKMLCNKYEQEKTKDNSSGTKIKRLPSSNSHKSKSSQRSLDKLIKKTSSEKSSRAKSAGAGSKDKVGSISDISHTRPKTVSSLSLPKKTSSIRRKSTSRLSLSDKSRSRNEEMLTPQIPPEYSEAWSLYTQEKNEEYASLVEVFKQNEEAAKVVYKTYLQEVEKLRDINARIEKHKNDLLLAKMTREFQDSAKYTNVKPFENFEKCCMQQLQKAEQDRVECKELILKCKGELKIYLNVCKDQKKELEEKFNEFCKEKYQTAVVGTQSEESIAVDVVDFDSKEEAKVDEPKSDVEETEEMIFERLKVLIDVEKRKKKLYLMKHKEWLNY